MHNFNTINIPAIAGRVANEIDVGWKTRPAVNFLEIRRLRGAETAEIEKRAGPEMEMRKIRGEMNDKSKRERERESGEGNGEGEQST